MDSDIQKLEPASFINVWRRNVTSKIGNFPFHFNVNGGHIWTPEILGFFFRQNQFPTILDFVKDGCLKMLLIKIIWFATYKKYLMTHPD